MIFADGQRSSTAPAEAYPHRRWSGLPVLRQPDGSLSDILNRLPYFGRQPFTMTSVNGTDIGMNPYVDMIYRVPSRTGDTPVPVGIVSKNYRLVDHHHVLRTIEQVLIDFEIQPSALEVKAEWTAHGERARFSLMLPREDRFTVVLGEQDDMRFRVEVVNSVEGSCRLLVIAGWLRKVCSNGLILGTALMQLRRQHRQELQIEEFAHELREALKCAGADQRTIADYRSRAVPMEVVKSWVDHDVCEKWGIKAAVRVLAICTDGSDVELAGDLRNRRPSEVATEKTVLVPGIDPRQMTAFTVSQALTWVAGDRGDIQEDLRWRSEVPELMQQLLRESPRARSRHQR